MANKEIELPYGFQFADGQHNENDGSTLSRETYNKFFGSYLRPLQHRNTRWIEIFGNTPTPLPKDPKTKRFIRKGIPQEHRPWVWMQVSGAEEEMKRSPQLYFELLSSPREGRITDRDVDSIQKDLRRTFPNNIYFSEKSPNYFTLDLSGISPSADGTGKRPLDSLRDVLIAFVMQNPKIGYCQGLNYIAALLLLVLKSENHAFWLLHILVTKILPPDYYSPTMSGLHVDLAVFCDLVQRRVPKVFRILEQYNLNLSVVVSKWFICLFADVLPVETTLRIWDVLLFEGAPAKILFRVALTLILANEQQVFIGAHDAGELFVVFRKIVHSDQALQCHSFLETVFKKTKSLKRRDIEAMRRVRSQLSTDENLAR